MNNICPVCGSTNVKVYSKHGITEIHCCKCHFDSGDKLPQSWKDRREREREERGKGRPR